MKTCYVLFVTINDDDDTPRNDFLELVGVFKNAYDASESIEITHSRVLPEQIQWFHVRELFAAYVTQDNKHYVYTLLQKEIKERADHL